MNATKIARTCLRHGFVICLGGIMVYPLLWMFVNSLKADTSIFSTSLFSGPLTLENYAQGWASGLEGVNFGTFIGNSMVISLLVVLGTLLTAPLVAYGFARIEFRFKKPLFGLMLVTMMLPSQITLIPQYTLFHNIGWINTFLPLVVPAFFGGSPFFIFLLVQFIRGLPRGLDEAAKIDGCSKFQIFIRIILPLLVPALITAGIFAFMWTWDDFFGQLIYLNSPGKFTVPVGLQLFMSDNGNSEWGQMFAMSFLSLIPSFIIFTVFQKYIVKGIATSGLK